MIVWFKTRHDQEWDFRTYDLRKNEKGEPIGYKSYKIKQEIGLSYNMANFQCALNTMWEATQNCFMLVCITSKT